MAHTIVFDVMMIRENPKAVRKHDVSVGADQVHSLGRDVATQIAAELNTRRRKAYRAVVEVIVIVKTRTIKVK